MDNQPFVLPSKFAVLISEGEAIESLQKLAKKLQVPLFESVKNNLSIEYFLSYQNNILVLVDKNTPNKQGISVNIAPRSGEQHSYPAPKHNDLAKAIGRQTNTVIDVTTGWGQDALALFRMGYEVECFERSPMMSALLEDGFLRLTQTKWVQIRQLSAPKLTQGNAINLLGNLQTIPDCIYLDPMFPPKRKKSALAKKSIQILQQVLGQDEDKQQLFEMAMRITGKRVVVKSPLYAEPLGEKPPMCFKGKLVRYDVYLKS
ncbi:MAG: class I SAM-dependent methyltransferase [Methylococcales bacterium]|nr:class I SAM-dependent methyltransferase [Methylococcales bacterium]MCK5926104.1 class I SAM-dependent methyltransferase [Methylococcales bacterium]